MRSTWLPCPFLSTLHAIAAYFLSIIHSYLVSIDVEKRKTEHHSTESALPFVLFSVFIIELLCQF